MKVVTDVVAFLILPPAGPLIALVVGLALAARRRRLGLWLASLAAAVLWVCSLPVVGVSLVHWLEPPPLAPGALAGASAIVVLGGGVIPDSPEYRAPALSSASLVRLHYAVRLGRDSALPVLVSGGSPYGGPPEGEVMAQVLRADFALAPRWVEKTSATTAEAAKAAFALLAPEGRKRIALVTTAWHMRRSARAFASAGFEVIPAPTGYVGSRGVRFVDFLPSAGGFSQTRIALWELAGILWYSF